MHKRKIAEQGISQEVLCAEYEAVYRYVLSLCRNDIEAQDITQETFLRAMKSYGKFEGNSSLYTWLCAIARKYSLQWTTQGRYLTGGVPPVRFSM